MTPELLAGIAGIVLSLLAAYLPGFKEWFAGLASDTKATVMAWLLLAIGVAVFVLGCAGLVKLAGLTCDAAGLFVLAQVLFAALVGNQATYVLFVRPYKAR